MLLMLGSQAKLENDNKSINVKRGMRARCEMGLWPCRPPTGYTKSKLKDQKCVSILDPDRAKMIKEMFEKIGLHGWSGHKLHRWLKYEVDFKTENGKHLCIGNLYRILKNHFYYGRFEYPKKSGDWYNGIHEPIIDKKLFDIVQEQIQSQTLVPRSAQKEFAFTRIMKCGLCESGITADEKYKKLKGGAVNRHIYYRCTRSRNPKCENTAINETDLILQLKKLIEDLDIKTLPMREKITAEVKRIKKFQRMLLGTTSKIYIKDIDVRNYAKFILQEGSIVEKREFFGCLKSDLMLEMRKLSLK
jgi:site-specific DNA recombinase